MTHAVEAAEYAHTKATHYADPGYQPDRKKRYALDSEEQCRAAWSYIHQKDNAAKYTPAQLARIKSRIKAAGKKYGITFAQDVAAAAHMYDVELARPGKWHLSTGPLNVTVDMLRDAARFANRNGARPAPVKLGHKDRRFEAAGDGEPALGWVHNVRLEQDDQGDDVLMGDVLDMPDWLAEAAPRHWPDRSIEGWANYEADGERYGLVVNALALLGVTPPGMSSIRSLRDLPAAVGVAASAPPSAQLVIASMADVEDSAPEAAEPQHQPHTQEGAGMDPALIREALGLSADASDEDVRAAVAAAGLAPPPEPATQPVAAAAKPGTILIEASAWEASQDRIRKLEAADARRRVEERDAVIAKAVQDGKFAPARREHWVRLWDADPEGTRQAIDGLAKNVMPVAASGYDADGQEGMEDEFAHLFPPTYARSSKEG